MYKRTTSKYSKGCGSLSQARQPDLLSVVKLIWLDLIVIVLFCYHIISSIVGISKTLLLKWGVRWWVNVIHDPEKKIRFSVETYYLDLFPICRFFSLLHLNRRYSTFEKLNKRCISMEAKPWLPGLITHKCSLETNAQTALCNYMNHL